MNLNIIFNDLEYLVTDIEYESYDPGDRDTPPVPGGVTGWGKIFHKDQDVTDVFNSLVDDDQFLEELEMIVEEEITDRMTDHLVDKYEL